MKPRARMYPPLWLLLFGAGAYALAQTPVPGPTWSSPTWLVAALGGAALLLVFSAAGLFRIADTTIDPFGDSRALVTAGPYRFTRNPMYLGMLLALTAWSLWLAHPLAGLAPPLFAWVVTTRHIRPEENRLHRLFGIEYDDYCCRTRRWL